MGFQGFAHARTPRVLYFSVFIEYALCQDKDLLLMSILRRIPSVFKLWWPINSMTILSVVKA